MRKTAKALAALLSAAMVVCAFCTSLTGSAASGAAVNADSNADEVVNLAAGKSYTYEHFDAEGKVIEPKTVDDQGIDKGFAFNVFLNKGCSDSNGTGGFLTDGKVRTSKLLDGSGAGFNNTSVELVGTFNSHAIDIDLGEACSVSSVVLATAHRGGNRYVNVAKLEVKVNGVWRTVQFTETAPLAAQIAAEEDQTPHQTHGKDLEGNKTGPADQYFDITLSFDEIANVTNVKVTIDTNYGETPSEAIQLTAAGRSYVAQLDEIQVFGTVGATETSDPAIPPTTADHPADITYKVTAIEDAKGLVTVTVTTPDTNVDAGKVVLSVSDKLTFKSVNANSVNGTVNKNYTAKDVTGESVNGVCVSFASATAIAPNTVVAVLTYQNTSGAELTTADVDVPEWNLSYDNERLGYRGWQNRYGSEVLVNSGYANVVVATNKVASVTYKVTAVEDAKGVVTVVVTAPNRNDVSSGKVVLSVSDKLTLVDVSANAVNGVINKNYDVKDINGKTVKGVCVSYASAAAIAPSTVVAVAKYQKTPGAELTDADIAVHEWSISDIKGKKLGQTGWVTKSGVETYVCSGLTDITVTPFTVLLGDVNGDDMVDNADAAAVLRHDARITILNDAQQAAADVNDDGIVDNSDAALILRYDAGIIKNF